MNNFKSPLHSAHLFFNAVVLPGLTYLELVAEVFNSWIKGSDWATPSHFHFNADDAAKCKSIIGIAIEFNLTPATTLTERIGIPPVGNETEENKTDGISWESRCKENRSNIAPIWTNID